MIRSNFPLLLAVPLALTALAACSGGDGDAEPTDLTEANSDGEARAMAAALPSGDFMELKLGARLVGPEGEEVKTALMNGGVKFADITSYVACPDDMSTCDPATAPEGTVYTYVHVVTPGGDNDPDSGDGAGADNSHIERTDNFRIASPAYGFTGDAGYAKAEALAAMGPSGDVVITCDESGIAWTLNNGDGGDQWEQKEPVTFYWRSTLPPAGASDVYRVHANYVDAIGSGPYPASREGVGNACG